MAKNSSNGVLKFDFSRVDIFDFQDLIEAESKRDYRKMAVIMAKACDTCPPEWGAPDKPETFRRPLKGEWSWAEVVKAFVESANDSGE